MCSFGVRLYWPKVVHSIPLYPFVASVMMLSFSFLVLETYIFFFPFNEFSWNIINFIDLFKELIFGFISFSLFYITLVEFILWTFYLFQQTSNTIIPLEIQCGDFKTISFLFMLFYDIAVNLIILVIILIVQNQIYFKRN